MPRTVEQIVDYGAALFQVVAVLSSWLGSSIFARDYGSARYRAQAESFERWVAPICVAPISTWRC